MKSLVTLAVALGVATAALAQTPGDLERRIRELEDRVRQQDRTIGEQDRKIEELRMRGGETDPARIEEAVDAYLDTKREKGELPALSDLSLEGVWKDGFKLTTRDKQHQLEIGGFLQGDGNFELAADDPLVSTFLIRRARIHAQGYLFKHYFYKIEGDFAGANAILQDGWIDVRYLDEAQLQFGQFKAPFGLEELTSDKYNKTIERSMGSSFITPVRQVGGMIHGDLFDKKIGYGVGLFNGNGQNARDNNDDKEFVGRIFAEPFRDSESIWVKGIHFGGAASYGTPELSLAGAGPRTAVGTRFFTFNPGTITEDERIRWGVEGAWFVGPVGFSGEYMEQIEDLGNPRTPTVFSGRGTLRAWYANASWFVTGEECTFKRVKVLSPFDPMGEKSGPGAWELVAQVGEFITDEEVQPFITGNDSATQYVAGVNWYPNPAVRLSVNYQHAEFSERALFGGERSEDSILFRVQLEF